MLSVGPCVVCAQKFTGRERAEPRVVSTQSLLPELVERLKTGDPNTVAGVLETANSVLKRCGIHLYPRISPS